MPARWPVHPPPLRDETLSSWLLRTARGNASSLSSWLATVGGRYDQTTSLDTQDAPSFWKALADGAGLAGGARTIRALTFVGVEKRLGAHAAGRWLLAVHERTDRPKHGYCAVCLAADATPYLRRAWRLEWVRWCPVHACRLEWGCRGCGAMLLPWQRPWHLPFTSCWACGRDVARCPPRGELAYATAPRFVRDALRESLAVALDEAPGTAARDAPFAAVWCLQKWAEGAGRESWPAWLAKLGLGTPQEATPPSDEDAVAWSFALAWHIATGPRERLAELALRHQATFNRATELHCPSPLRPLRRPVYPPRQITADDVEEVVASLIENDQPVTHLAVAEALGVSPSRIGGNAALRAVVDRAGPVLLAQWCATMRATLAASRDRLHARQVRLSRAKLAADAGVSLEAIARFERETGETFAVSPCEEYADLVRSAIVTLREAGERVTTVAVARTLGRERSFIEKRPDLKRLIQAARNAKPTPEEVRRACRELRARDVAVTTLGVARVLGRGREVVERTPTLRAVVDEERNIVRLEMEHTIRAAARALCERGESITTAAVCREIGRDRSYVEKRGRLRDVVLREQRAQRGE